MKWHSNYAYDASESLAQVIVWLAVAIIIVAILTWNVWG